MCRRGSPMFIEDKVTAGTSMASPLPQLPQRHTSRVTNSESTWGPCEPASRDKQPAQPYRLQKANKSDGQWSRWASDIRQSQPDQWRDERRRRALMEESVRMEGSKWSAPTRGALVGSEYDTDQEWHLRSMRYGDGWAYHSTSEPL